MQWNSVGEFLAMGGYATYVWSSFGLAALIVIVEVVQARQRRAEVLRSLRAQFEAERAGL